MTRRAPRFAAVATGIAALAAVPAILASLPVPGVRVDPATLLQRIRASGAVGYDGYAESRGSLSLPELPNAGSVATLLSTTSRLRVWYAGPQRMRVDQLSLIGENDTYVNSNGELRWSSDTRRVRDVVGQPSLRLPEARDLLPPDLGRRLAAAATPAQLRTLDARRIAGRTAAGVRIVPSGQTTIARIDIWADPRTGLPLRVDVIAKGARTAALTTRFLDVRLQRPSVAVTTFRPPPDADVDETTAPDLVSAIDRSSPYQLPDTIAGIRQRPRVHGLHGGAATYGDGYTIVAVLPISDGLAYGTIDRLTPTPTGLPGVAASTAAWVLTPLTSTLVVTAPNGNYLLTGTVPLSLLETMARALEAGPLPFREGSGP